MEEKLEEYTRSFFKRAVVRRVLGDNYHPSSKQVERLHRLFRREGSPKQIENMLTTVAHFVINDLNNYVGRYRRIRKLGCGTTRYSTLLRYGQNRYSEVYLKHADKRTAHLGNRVRSWTDRGYTEEQAIAEVKNVQKDRNRRAVLKMTGTSLYTVRSCEYWIARGHTPEDAQTRVRKIQTTNGIDYYRERYGADGDRMFEERIKKWQSTLEENNDIEEINLKKSHSVRGGLARGLSLEEATLHYERTCERLRSGNCTFSKISQKMCQMLQDQLGDECYYAGSPHEYRIGRYRVDFYHKPSKTVVEFYGDFWHANPEKFIAEDVRHGKIVEHVWKDDRERELEIQSSHHSNQLIIVWEKDFRKNPQSVVNNIIKEITKCKSA